MLKPEMQTALNAQFGREQTAAQEYLAMAAYFEGESLSGFAKFMRAQVTEESEHAMRFFDYLYDRGGEVTVGALAAPTGSFESARSVFQAALELEQMNTTNISALYRLAREVDDPATETMLHWFIQEQVEEEHWGTEALALLDMVGDNRSALLMLDKRYGEKAER